MSDELKARPFCSDGDIDLSLTIAGLRAENKVLLARAENWEKDALNYCNNSFYWRARAETAEADNVRLREMVERLIEAGEYMWLHSEVGRGRSKWKALVTECKEQK